MKQVGKNRIKIQRGEAILLTIDLKTEDGEQYVLPKDAENPYVVVTIHNSKYNTGEWYDMNFWVEYDGSESVTLRLDNIFTHDLIQGQYNIGVKVVAGQTTYEVLKSMYESLKDYKRWIDEHDTPDDCRTLYEAIKFLAPDMVKNFDWTVPLTVYTVSDIIDVNMTLLVN